MSSPSETAAVSGGNMLNRMGTMFHDAMHRRAHTESEEIESTWIEKLPENMQGPVDQLWNNEHTPTAAKVVGAAAAVWLASEVAMGVVGVAVISGGAALIAPKKTYDAVFGNPEAVGLAFMIAGVADRSLGTVAIGGGMFYFSNQISQMIPPSQNDGEPGK